jgi:hypothetical protein
MEPIQALLKRDKILKEPELTPQTPQTPHHRRWLNAGPAVLKAMYFVQFQQFIRALQK